MPDILKKAILDAQIVRDIALANAKKALESAFIGAAPTVQYDTDILEKLHKLSALLYDKNGTEGEKKYIESLISQYQKSGILMRLHLNECNRLYKKYKKGKV